MPKLERKAKKNKYLVYLSHPSHYYVLREIMFRLRNDGHTVFVVIKTKDILSILLDADKVDYKNVQKTRGRRTLLTLAFKSIMINIRLLKHVIINKIDVVLSCGSDIGFAMNLANKKHFLFNDDDYFIVPNSAKYGWPYVTKIFAPQSCDMGNYKHKTVFYKGYQKSFYINESFRPDKDIVIGVVGKERYVIIRVVSLTAHHDDGIKGISESVLKELVQRIEKRRRVFISSEKELPAGLEKYRLTIKLTDIHHFLYYADLLVADSQSMVHEAALLGTPSIRHNSFVGRIGVLEELEHKYRLTVGVKPDNKQLLFEKVDEILSDSNIKEVYQERKCRMQSDMIDVNEFVIGYLESLSGK